jgi:hypothetical protein
MRCGAIKAGDSSTLSSIMTLSKSSMRISTRIRHTPAIGICSLATRQRAPLSGFGVAANRPDTGAGIPSLRLDGFGGNWPCWRLLNREPGAG